MASDDFNLSTIKLTDFGIAKLAESQIAVEMELFDKDAATLTSSNTLLGAVPYMAPECWANWRKAGQPMDIWSLGCLAYQLLAGEPPFGMSRMAIANVIKTEHSGITLKTPDWFGRHPNTKVLESELWKIVESCIKFDPSQRASAESVIGACNALCYSAAPRRVGKIQRFKVAYPGGGKGNFGFIDDLNSQDSWFFHGTEFYGGNSPQLGQRVSFSAYSGSPAARCSPILLLR